MDTVQLLVFSLIWIGIVYCFNSLLARKFIAIEPKKALLYIVTMAALGLLGEIVFDSTYRFVFGRPLWEYHVLPIHNAYTSVYSLFLWGMVGLHIYLLHGVLQSKGVTSLHKLAAIFCAEAIILEVLVNLTFVAAFGDYIFYYNPGDLWHITSLQTLPLYLLAGYITVSTLRFASRRQTLATLGSTALALALVGIGRW